MKKLIFIITILTLPLSCLWAQTQIYNSYFNPPQSVYNWDIAGSPYEIMEDIEIPQGSNLIIKPGVEVLFQGHYKMDVKGSINAIGTVNEMIIITSQTEPWNGIRFDFTDGGTPTPSKFHYCEISKAGKTGTICNSGPDPESSGGAIYVEGFSDLEICYCEIFDNTVLAQGGAIGLYSGSSPLISWCNIHDNNALNRGGGICMMVGCKPEITHNTFAGNVSEDKGGGAIAIGNLGSGTPCYPIINSNYFSNNSVGENGGGVFICNSSPTDFENNTFENNTADGKRGGIYIRNNSTLDIVNNVFSENQSYLDGGGVYIASGLDVTIVYCQFEENNAVNGGGIYLASDSYIENCEFKNNNASSNGGGVYITCSETEIIFCSFDGNTSTANGGGIYMDDPVESSISLNSFESNTAYQGGALYYFRNSNYLNPTEILNNLFVENHATDMGVVYMQGNNNNTIFNHNTVSNNTAAYWISGVCIEDNSYFPSNFKNNIIYESVVDLLIISGQYALQRPSNYLILAGINYFNNDNAYNPNPVPGFVSSTNYHLTSTSILCIDAGDNYATITSTDLDGNFRIINGNVNGYNTDFGCYEYNP
ncbi:MAG: right-handed parallel beta-helix repeat-containing protein [Saprospiraceae bacterium]|nr:right-handed parallel beta-helix repeat-containing protein [Saprospiraceae bacterium]